MPFKTGVWGDQAKERNIKRREYFRQYQRLHGPPKKVFRLGHYGELLAEKILTGSKIVNQSTHDLEWNGKNIEVKTSCTLIGSRYRFNVAQQIGKTDYFLFIAVSSTNKEILFMHLIPDHAIKSKVSFYIHTNGDKNDKYRVFSRKERK